MTNDIWDDTDAGDADGKGLRAQLKKALEANKTLQEQFDKAQAKATAAAVKDVLSAKGIDPRIGRFLVRDEVDPSDEAAVDKWLEENGDLFTKPTPKVEQGSTAQGEEQEEPGQEEAGRELPFDVDQFAAQQGLRQAAGQKDIDTLGAALGSLGENATPEDVLKAVRPVRFTR